MSPTQKKVRIWWDPKVSAYRLQGDFKAELIDFLKANIPSDQRNYEVIANPNAFQGKEHLWTFTEQYFDGMCKAAVLFFGQPNVAILSRQQVESASQPRPNTNLSTQLTSLDSMLCEFMKLIPFEAAQSAYRKAAMVLHPDRQGGSMEKMTRLNSIWTKIEKEIYKQ